MRLRQNWVTPARLRKNVGVRPSRAKGPRWNIFLDWNKAIFRRRLLLKICLTGEDRRLPYRAWFDFPPCCFPSHKLDALPFVYRRRRLLRSFHDICFFFNRTTDRQSIRKTGETPRGGLGLLVLRTGASHWNEDNFSKTRRGYFFNHGAGQLK